MQNYNPKFKTDLKGRCYQFSLDLIIFIDSLPNQQSTRIIADQVIRSGTSIGANITEAKASSSRLEFKKFHEISLKSANETKYWLELLKDSKKGDPQKLAVLIQEVTELANMLAAGILKLKGKTSF